MLTMISANPLPLYIVGGLLLLAGIAVLIVDARRVRQTARTEATVVAVSSTLEHDSILSSGKDGRYRHTPTLEYQVDGRSYRVQGQPTLENYRIGQQLTIRYDPRRPDPTQGLSFRALGNLIAAVGALIMVLAALA